jgi:hypothetical protein
MLYLGITLGQKVYLEIYQVHLCISFGPKDIPRYTMDITVWDNSVYLGISQYNIRHLEMYLVRGLIYSNWNFIFLI